MSPPNKNRRNILRAAFGATLNAIGVIPTPVSALLSGAGAAIAVTPPLLTTPLIEPLVAGESVENILYAAFQSDFEKPWIRNLQPEVNYDLDLFTPIRIGMAPKEEDALTMEIKTPDDIRRIIDWAKCKPEEEKEFLGREIKRDLGQVINQYYLSVLLGLIHTYLLPESVKAEVRAKSLDEEDCMTSFREFRDANIEDEALIKLIVKNLQEMFELYFYLERGLSFLNINDNLVEYNSFNDSVDTYISNVFRNELPEYDKDGSNQEDRFFSQLSFANKIRILIEMSYVAQYENKQSKQLGFFPVPNKVKAYLDSMIEPELESNLPPEVEGKDRELKRQKLVEVVEIFIRSCAFEQGLAIVSNNSAQPSTYDASNSINLPITVPVRAALGSVAGNVMTKEDGLAERPTTTLPAITHAPSTGFEFDITHNLPEAVVVSQSPPPQP